MSFKEHAHHDDKAAAKQKPSRPESREVAAARRQSNQARAVQLARTDPDSLTAVDVRQLQRTVGNRALGNYLSGAAQERAARQENKTGLPDRLKAGIESLSGLSVDDVKVHYNSHRPAEVRALAYTQGTDIHVAPGQEAHLPHEAWHVVQQKQGRVRPTLLAKSVEINDDDVLEREADALGARASRMTPDESARHSAGPTDSLSRLRAPSAPGGRIIQRQTHGFLGTMIHHAPAPLGNTNIDNVNKLFYPPEKVLDSRRGELRKKPEQKFAWDFTPLAKKIYEMREKAGVPAKALTIAINANWMVSPGYEQTPEEYMDESKTIFAISSVWGFKYQAPPGGVVDEEVLSESSGEEDDYDDVLKGWQKARDANKSTRTKTTPLGDEAQKLLRTHAKDKVSASRNDAIPHRGLRNAFFKDEWFMEGLRGVEDEADFVHIITLDSDADLGTGAVVQEIGKLAEKHLAQGGLHLTATDYVYERADLFEWFAGMMDKVGRKKLEQRGYDAYPAEPGLTISYSSLSKEEAQEFLKGDPFGPEYSGSATGGGFKDLVNSSQSVEGKNIRAKWRNFRKNQEAMIFRTDAYLNVKESEAQIKGHKGTLATLRKALLEEKPISAQLIGTLIGGDNYHSLTPDRNSTEKRAVQKKIIEEATGVLNMVLGENKGASVEVLKPKLNEALKKYMQS